MAEKFCNYCRKFKASEGFVATRQSGTPRAMCPTCQDIRKKPREQLQELAKQEAAERNRKRPVKVSEGGLDDGKN